MDGGLYRPNLDWQRGDHDQFAAAGEAISCWDRAHLVTPNGPRTP